MNINAGRKYFRKQPLLIIMAEMGFGAGSVGLFLGDEGKTRDMGKEMDYYMQFQSNHCWFL